MRIIDISLTLEERLPPYPGLRAFSRRWLRHYERGHEMAVSEFAMSTHVGTHLDAPFHFLAEGKTLDELPLSTYYGKVQVIEVNSKKVVSARDLLGTSIQAERVLLKTSNSRREDLLEKFSPDYVYLGLDAAQYLVESGIRLLGIDYFSVDKPHDRDKVAHRLLLGAGIVILEGIFLGHVRPGLYKLLCFPLKISGADGAPVRAILIEE